MILKIINLKNKGFTLIELIIFMGIFSILITVMFQLFIAIFDTQLESQSTSSVATDGRYLLSKFTNDIKNATPSSILSPSVGSSASALVISNGASTYSYSLSGGNLILTVNPAGTIDQLNSANTSVSSLNFFRLADNLNSEVNTVSITFTLTSKAIKRSGTVSQIFNLTAGTR